MLARTTQADNGVPGSTTHVGGLHSVKALLVRGVGDVELVYHLERRRDVRIRELLALARAGGVETRSASRETLDRLAGDRDHHGVLARVRSGSHGPRREGLIEHLASCRSPLVLVLDEVQDPHNLGACLRSADAAGVDAVVTPVDNSAGLTPTVRKVAAGAAETVAWFQVTNLARCLDELKAAGIWLHGAAGEADAPLYALDLSGPVAIVLGAEGDGLRRLTRERCDTLFQIPMHGNVESLNVSVAAGIALFEARRQRALPHDG